MTELVHTCSGRQNSFVDLDQTLLTPFTFLRFGIDQI